MTATACADPSFGLSAQALAILQLLAGEDPTFADYEDGRYLVTIETFPWYNGKEKGVALTVQAYSQSCLIIAFGEHRASDQIFVEHWVDAEPPFNCPTPTTHSTRDVFPARNYAAVVDHILDLMKAYYNDTKTAVFGLRVP